MLQPSTYRTRILFGVAFGTLVTSVFFYSGPVEKGSPKKAGRRDQALLANGERR